MAAILKAVLRSSELRTNDALSAERKFLWGVCYRMTGSASDADDLVQETFVRALERPPADTSMPWRPWLVRVAMNLAKDHLRKRKRRGYSGLWLPTPIETADGPDALAFDPASSEASPEARYGLVESASFAFLVAVDALNASQRAVLLLRDVFDYSSRETAEALELKEENVRITLHRARKIMAGYDRNKPVFDQASGAAVEAALHRIMACMATRDLGIARSLIAPETRALGDGGGVYAAGRIPVLGGEKVLKMYGKLATFSSRGIKFSVRPLNGLPALVTDDPAPRYPNAPRMALLVDLDRDGRIRTMFTVTAPDKLTRINWQTVG